MTKKATSQQKSPRQSSRQSAKPLSGHSPFLVLDHDQIVFRCDDLYEGVEFIDRRGRGVLYGSLYRRP